MYKYWKIDIILPIYKKDNKRHFNNYRAIILYSVPRKVFSRTVEKRVRSKLEDTQCGFRKNRST